MEQVTEFIVKSLAAGGGGAMVAYCVFKWLGKSWIENKFKERLEQLKHQQQLQLELLKIEINSMLSAAIKLQEREFTILPEAWAKLDEAIGLITYLVHPAQQYVAVGRMNTAQLEEFLDETEFLESQKDEIRKSKDKFKTYQEFAIQKKIYRAKSSFFELQRYVALNGIFLTTELSSKFKEISDMLWSAIVSKDVGNEAKDWTIQRQGWVKIQSEAEPLYLEIRELIQNRLRSHSLQATSLT